MPIHKMVLEDGVFYAKQVGYVDNVDGRMWASTLANHAKRAALPLIALIDITEVHRFCPTVVNLISSAVATPNVNAVIIVTGTSLNSQVVKIIDKIGRHSGLHFVPTMEEAILIAAAPPAPPSGGSGYAPAPSFTLFSTFSNNSFF
jgi:hypothetical protein